MKMKAVAVLPGKPDSIHMAELPKPALEEIPNGRGVLVKILQVGVDGTDKEINAAEYGGSPPGYKFLVIGHESFGIVESVGPKVTELVPGDPLVRDVVFAKESRWLFTTTRLDGSVWRWDLEAAHPAINYRVVPTRGAMATRWGFEACDARMTAEQDSGRCP